MLCDELLWQGITVTVIGFLSSGVYFIIILISMLSTPFLIIGIMCEFIIRVALCKLACPDKVMIKNNFHYQIFRHKNSSSNDTECVVCLDNFNDGDEIVMLKCHDSHIYHEKCMLEWIERSQLCPICRKEIEFHQ